MLPRYRAVISENDVVALASQEKACPNRRGSRHSSSGCLKDHIRYRVTDVAWQAVYSSNIALRLCDPTAGRCASPEAPNRSAVLENAV